MNDYYGIFFTSTSPIIFCLKLRGEEYKLYLIFQVLSKNVKLKDKSLSK